MTMYLCLRENTHIYISIYIYTKDKYLYIYISIIIHLKTFNNLESGQLKEIYNLYILRLAQSNHHEITLFFEN